MDLQWDESSKEICDHIANASYPHAKQLATTFATKNYNSRPLKAICDDTNIDV